MCVLCLCTHTELSSGVCVCVLPDEVGAVAAVLELVGRLKRWPVNLRPGVFVSVGFC